MKKIKAYCGIGFVGAVHEEKFEFEDDVTEDEILSEINDWADGLLEIWWEESEEE